MKLPKIFIFYFYPLPILFFSISTAATGIAGALLIIYYIYSGYWRNWKLLYQRRWTIPLSGLMLWTFLGLLWSNDVSAGLKVAQMAAFGIYAFMGATLPWEEKNVRLFIRLFLLGLFINAIIAVLKSTGTLIIPYGQPHQFVGLASHIWWSMALTQGLLWFLWDWRHRWAFPRWIIAPVALLFFAVLILSPARSGQLLFIILVPAAIWILYSGQWRYWGLGTLLLAITAMSFSPMVEHRVELGISNLQQFWNNPNRTETSWGIRIATMEAGAEMFFNHPIIGVGTGDFSQQMIILQKQGIVTKTPGIINTSASNSYLSEAAALGLPGIILFLWFIWSVSLEAWRVRLRPQGWFVLTYLGIFWVGGLYNTLIWGYVDAMEIALFAGLPLIIKTDIQNENL
ncbi:O-antigen ligase family protein [Acidithiobacillus concretivorus]|uniref:O-antigen ligase family protein n=1 Tax=Acidithiobacillus concretivorus TaxID=3063952 RepID=A0ABS5ZMJ1_9PROT|nr:O-antigen ligase family protein [Acidithiobacillus concretivorus]MBU2737388.1 O-antigen ligase family protein [Acidithiobacillus concretivorus]